MTKADEKWDSVGDNPMVMASEIRSMMEEAEKTWADETTEFLDDPDVGKVLDLTTKIIAGQIPEPAKIAAVCTRLSAYSLKFRTRYSAYMSFAKGTTEANMKKNHYKELYTGIDRLVDSLKYVAK